MPRNLSTASKNIYVDLATGLQMHSQEVLSQISGLRLVTMHNMQGSISQKGSTIKAPVKRLIKVLQYLRVHLQVLMQAVKGNRNQTPERLRKY